MGYQRVSVYVGMRNGEDLLRFPVTTELKGKEELAKLKLRTEVGINFSSDICVCACVCV